MVAAGWVIPAKLNPPNAACDWLGTVVLVADVPDEDTVAPALKVNGLMAGALALPTPNPGAVLAVVLVTVPPPNVTGPAPKENGETDALLLRLADAPVPAKRENGAAVVVDSREDVTTGTACDGVEVLEAGAEKLTFGLKLNGLTADDTGGMPLSPRESAASAGVFVVFAVGLETPKVKPEALVTEGAKPAGAVRADVEAGVPKEVVLAEDDAEMGAPKINGDEVADLAGTGLEKGAIPVLAEETVGIPPVIPQYIS